MGVFFRLSRADNFIVCGSIWTKFELLLDIMHVQDTSKFKMDRINSSREKVATSIFTLKRAANYVVPGQIWPSFELIQAHMYVIVT